jgi:hypothetical protein
MCLTPVPVATHHENLLVRAVGHPGECKPPVRRHRRIPPFARRRRSPVELCRVLVKIVRCRTATATRLRPRRLFVRSPSATTTRGSAAHAGRRRAVPEAIRGPATPLGSGHLVPGNEPLFNNDIAVAAARLHLLADADSRLRSYERYPSTGGLDMRVVCHVRPEFARGQAGFELEIRRSHDDFARPLLPPERVEPRFEPRFV